MSARPSLIDDCFRPGAPLIRHDDAVALLKARIGPVVGVEKVPLTAAGRRVLAKSAMAQSPVPAHANAAVDGYAFAFAAYEAAGGAPLPVCGRSAAGHPLATSPQPGAAVQILTGAVVPAGLDTVVMQEDCRVDTGDDGQIRVSLPDGARCGSNIRKAGEDLGAGAVLFEPGHVLRPQDLAALASIGMGDVTCYSRLRVALVSTGDEVVRAGARPLAAGEVYDANVPMLSALARLAGADVTDLGVWPDDRGIVEHRLDEAARSFDLVLTSGGASKGAEDHMAASLMAHGTRHFWEIAVKPGRPMMLGQIGATPVVGLPGNPVAVFVCFLMYVFPMLRRMGGAPWPEPRRLMLPAAFSIAKRKLGRREFWRGMLVATPSGLAVDKFARDGSGLISGLVAADGLIDCPEDRPGVAPGEPVAFIPFTEFGIVA
ncbi:MAG: molybdopterin molybdotransferase MoeA [Hyphomicrobium sp.]